MERTEIDIRLNGRPATIATGTTVAVLLGGLCAGGAGTAVAVNELIIRRDHYADTTLHPGDRIEVIQAVGGG